MDRAKLRSQVFEKTGIKVDVDDPVFALVALNEAVLEETVERHLERIEAASLELAQQARNAGGLPPAAAATPAAAPAATAVPHATATVIPLAPAVAGARPISTTHEGFSPRELRLLAGAAAVSMLTAGLVLAGQALFRTPPQPPAAAPVPALTATQSAAIARAEKLDRILPTLDAKTRTAVETALTRP